MLSDDTDEQSDELYNLRFKQLCTDNNTVDDDDDSLQIDKKLRNYGSLNNDAESKNFLEQHHELISMESHDKLIELAINKEMNDVIFSLI
ncbi:unnamed protein product [Adineta steineri]|uniref:Uncharacterized protein n=1 Tax=Adineta steineri TaxID=433720 RepID=A0A814YM51_9BILA|nr:unnamed protein product [Adineta steineri]CAF1265089.1 unnamed protein product [Adineta steineri]CAF3859938.1 unnamed protein product [Adineta steineri]CAF3860770.1 unnamed protein product [Adineta steineri]